MRKQWISLPIFLLLPLFFTASLQAQENTDTTAVYYIADYDIEWESLMEWNESYRNHSVPLLRALEEEGIITRWSAWMHNSAGEYNWRMVVGSTGWDKLDEFWDEYLGRMPEEAMQQTSGMIRAHSDQIWDATMVNYGDQADQTKYAYELLYRVDFSDMSAMMENTRENEIPRWNDGIEQGMITGWVILGHNTGGSYNHGVVWLFDDWDKMDDFAEYALEYVLTDEDKFKEVFSMINDHTDIIWESVPMTMEGSN